MNIKALTMTALLGVFLAGSSAQAWWGHGHGYHKKHHKVKVYKKIYVKPVYVKPSMYHSHPANGLTNDTYHTHPNGLRHHVHNYGTGGHKHGGHSYDVCPYPH